MRLSKAGARIALALVGIAAIAVVATGSAIGGNTDKSIYIVEMAESPTVAYKGGVEGIKATKPAKGEKIDPASEDAVKYAEHLKGEHDKALKKVGGTKKVQDYVYAYNGFAAELTEAQAEKLRMSNDVLAVNKDEMLKLDTSSTPSFLGLNAPGGLWEQLTDKDGKKKWNKKKDSGPGEDVVIGIVDGGIWPESLSFCDKEIKVKDKGKDKGTAKCEGKETYDKLKKKDFKGECVKGEEFKHSDCSNKIVGARYYNAGFGGDEGIDASYPYEYNSPRDFGGHGTHTASTAGGNAGVPTTGAAAPFGTISGIAPRARISVYKVCWETGGGGSCSSVDSVAAIDQAVADGVDVINYSISGSTTNFRDSVEIAFLFAADAGVFVATSAGNSGPGSSTVAHPGPWLTTVAAGTHNRNGAGSVTLGNSALYSGPSLAATAVGPAPLINAEDAGMPGADAEALALCFSAADGATVLDPAKVVGKIVVCDRGVTPRVNKSLAVKDAGGVGMILVNTSANSTNADFHFVPTVHLQDTDRAAVKTYAATSGATATINQATLTYTDPAPFTASFSSRGPLRAGNGDLLKPDVIAPGQDILAAVAPPGNNGRDFDLYSGTSMSSPHVAGLAALLKDAHPDWSPMAIKSALMTTGTDVLDGGTPAPNTDPVLIFRQGAGHVRPNSAVDPGLVFDSGFNDWLNFICGTQPGSFCSAFTPIDPSDLNVASIAIGDLAGSQTVTRSVTNVGSDAETYTASSTGLVGITVTLPGAMSIAKGATASFDVTFVNDSAAVGSYVGGQLTLTGDKGHVVRIPMVIRPVVFAAPKEVSGSYDVKFGYSGTFTATARGLIPATVTDGTVDQDPDQTFDPADPAGTVAIPVTIPAGTTYARFSLFDADVAPGSDMDLYVYRGITPVGGSGGGTSAEEVNLTNPTAADYTVYVHGWGLPSGSSPFKLHTWLLDSTDALNMTVTAPASVTIGDTGTIDLAFTGLSAGTKYLGSVAYGGTAGLPSPTIVRVDQP